MVLDVSSDAPIFYCSFCGAKIQLINIQKCLDCGATFCLHCASQLQVHGTQIKCPCGSNNIEGKSSSKNWKAETLEQIFELRRSLKKVGYSPVIVLKRTGHLESRLRSLRKQFFIPGNQIDHIFLETKKIENFMLPEFHEYSNKLNKLYRTVMGLNSSITDIRNLSLQLTLFQKQISGFDQTVQVKLQPIYEQINQVTSQCDEFETMVKELSQYFDIFVFIPGELGIGFFSNIELQNNRIRRTMIDLVISTDRITMLRKRRNKVIGHKTVIYDEFPPEDLIDVQKTNGGFLKRDKLSITTIKHDYTFYSDSRILLRIFDSLQLSYYGRPSDIYINEPFRDWSSEIYQEKLLSALNFQHTGTETNKKNDTLIHQEKDPDFVIGVLDDRLRDLRIRKLANEKALQELKEGRRKVANRDYFELIKQFELELAKINEEITELLIRTGKTNILNKI